MRRPFIYHLLGSPSFPRHRLYNQPGSCVLGPASCFILLLPAVALWPSLPPFRRPPFQEFLPPPAILGFTSLRARGIRPVLVPRLPCNACLASMDRSPGECTLDAHLAPPRPTLLLPAASTLGISYHNRRRALRQPFPCAKWVDGAIPHPFPPDDPTAANAHAAPTDLSHTPPVRCPSMDSLCRPVGASPPPRPHFHQMLSSATSLFGVMHCDARLSMPRSGSSLWLLSRRRLPSAPVCYSFGLPAAQQPFRQIPLRTYSCSPSAITPTR